MSRLLYFVIIKPLSLIPLSVLYYLSDFLYLLVYKVFGYRKKVVESNLKRAFPNCPASEIKATMNGFYSHLCDLIVESIRIFSISECEAVRRCKLINPEVLDEVYDQGRSAIVLCGHYNNWEMAGVAFAAQVKHQGIGIYTPLSNRFFDDKFARSRSKFGLKMIPKKLVKSTFAENIKNKVLTATAFGTDQSPSPATKRVYWTEFLNQDTAVLYGGEKYARELNSPVIFMRIKKVKRGYYEFTFENICNDPVETAHGEITELHTRLLEKQIIEQPEHWLWSHKRWKRKRSDYPEESIVAQA